MSYDDSPDPLDLLVLFAAASFALMAVIIIVGTVILWG